MSRFSAREAASPALLSPRLLAGAGLGTAVFFACLLGIATRPLGGLAAIWVANAVFLTFLLRVPASATWFGWLCAAAGYVLADMLHGADLSHALGINLTNMAGVAAGYLCYRRLSPEMTRLRHPVAMLYLAAISAFASLAAGIAGGLANPFLFQGSILSGVSSWFGGELVNYMTTLPVLLSAPGWRWDAWKETLQDLLRRGSGAVWPVAALLLTCLLSLALRGPGAVTFQVPALLWCGLVFPVFPTTILTFLAEGWVLMVLPDPAYAQDQAWLASFRLGVSLVAVAPIMLSAVMQNRNELLEQLQYHATHDGLTGALDRRAFHSEAQAGGREHRPGCGLLMIDLDHFKSVNDTHGHAAGDAVLAAVAERIRRCLRPDDLFGRIGGEEFAIAVRNSSRQEAASIGERIRNAVAAQPVSLPSGDSVPMSASIGMALCEEGQCVGFDALLAAADAALYQAKRQGRDQVVYAWQAE